MTDSDETKVRAYRPEELASLRAKHRASLLALSGGSAGTVFECNKDTLTLGRAGDCDICLMDDGVSRYHARLERKEDHKVTLTDLGSTNGTYVNNVSVTHHVLKDGDRIGIGSANILKFSYADTLEQNFNINRYRQAVFDDLTGTLNRRGWLDELRRELAYASRCNWPASVILFDVDRFKAINDIYGHPAGDDVLRLLAEVVQKALRQEDSLGRYGGEEFAILLRGEDANGAYATAERIRRLVEATEFLWENQPIWATISAGVVTREPGALYDSHKMLEIADRNLYAAKNGGRNQTVSSSE